jgi:predicted acetyltransferase
MPRGDIQVLPAAEAAPYLPDLYEAARRGRPGMLGRPSSYLRLLTHEIARSSARLQVAVHTGEDGNDGYALYRVTWARSNGSEPRRALHVDDMHCRTPEAWADLWRFLVGIDLVDEVRAPMRPLDEPLEWLFTDPRACRFEEADESWLRVIDVPSALGARGYGSDETIVIGVVDAMVPRNAGNYRIASGTVERTDEPAALTFPADALGAVYLGGTRPSALAAAGRIAASSAEALAIADRLFVTDQTPWCGTYF